MARFVRVCSVGEVEPGTVRQVVAAGTTLALARVEDRFYALTNLCPHLQGELGRGWLEGRELVCPRHRWRFRLSTGRCPTMPGVSATTYECKVEGNDVYVAV